MARPAQYNCNEVLWKATLLFWEKGYRAVSIADLVQATGLQPGSLYGRFGSKEGLFLECIEHYQQMSERFRAEHAKGSSPLARLRSFHDAMVEMATNDDEQRGCFVVNASLECDATDRQIKETVRGCMERGEAWIKRQLDDAVAEGELRGETDTALLAGCFSSSFYGYRVMSRAGDQRERLPAIAAITFDSIIDPWRPEAATGNILTTDGHG